MQTVPPSGMDTSEFWRQRDVLVELQNNLGTRLGLSPMIVETMAYRRINVKIPGERGIGFV
jgi:hypothetical protein